MSREEQALLELWGAMLGAFLQTDDPKIHALFAKADAKCRELGFIAPQVK